MIISLVALLLAPPVSARSLDVVVPNAIVPLHNEYVACQDENFNIQKVRDRTSFKAEVERGIAACKEKKVALMSQAETTLASTPDFRDPAIRQRAITEAFDGHDRVRRLMALQ
jgi:hypothetical protein